MINTANLENCKKLYELSGWDDLDYHYSSGIEHRVMKFRVNGYYEAPAYDLGYLLRKLPQYTQLFFGDKYKWYCNLLVLGDFVDDTASVTADTPEDAASLLTIKLFEQGILTAPSNKEAK